MFLIESIFVFAIRSEKKNKDSNDIFGFADVSGIIEMYIEIYYCYYKIIIFNCV
jgi:uncharacterized protein (UPF0262 family)